LATFLESEIECTQLLIKKQYPYESFYTKTLRKFSENQKKASTLSLSIRKRLTKYGILSPFIMEDERM